MERILQVHVLVSGMTVWFTAALEDGKVVRVDTMDTPGWIEQRFIETMNDRVGQYLDGYNKPDETLFLGVNGTVGNYDLVPIQVNNDRAPNTVGALRHYLEAYDSNDRVTYEDQDFDGEPGALTTPYLDDDYDGVERSDGSLGLEIRICANLSDYQLAEKTALREALQALIDYCLPDEDKDLVFQIESGELEAVEGHIMKHIITIQSMLGNIADVGTMDLGNTPKDVWVNVLSITKGFMK